MYLLRIDENSYSHVFYKRVDFFICSISDTLIDEYTRNTIHLDKFTCERKTTNNFN